MIGYYAGQHVQLASNSTLIGYYACLNTVSGAAATIIGREVGVNANDVTNATMMGYYACRNTPTASNAVIIGYQAGYNSLTSSVNCTYIGYQADALAGLNVTESIAIGYNAKVSGSKMCAIGGTGVDAVKVGMGTNNPQNTLDVVGNISCSVITASMYYPMQAGSASVSGGTSANITLNYPMPSANYAVLLQGYTLPLLNSYVTAKTTVGFTASFTAFTGAIDWMVLPYTQ
jgi:hypothetical protein